MAEQDSRQVPISEAMRLATEHQQAGRLEVAESIYRAVLDSEPTHADASYNLALIALQSGRPAQAAPVLKAAIERDPDNAAYWMNYAVVLVAGGNPAAARELLLQARARGLGGKALADLLAQVERMAGAGAATVVETIDGDERGQARAINYSALVQLGRQGRHAELERQALELSRQFPDAGPLWRLLGAAQLEQNKHEPAGESLRRASTLMPGDAPTFNLLGLALRRARRNAEAVEAHRRAIALDGTRPEYHANLANALLNLGSADEAMSAARQALALAPDDAQAHLSLARSLYELGETAAARQHYRAASDAAPAMIEASSAYLFCLAHDDSVTPEASFAEHVRIGDRIEAPLRQTWRPHDNDRDPERDLRIGFVSADLKEHPIAYLVEPVWRAMRTGRNRIIAYAHLFAEDAVSSRLRALTDDWVRIDQMRDEALCERIRADRIDILFDLSGHTTYNRLTAFARRPAPIQVSWFGYPGTTGLSAMDYRFVRGYDAEGDGLERKFREKLVRFRHRGFQPDLSAPPVNPLPALEGRPLTFGSFNRVGKIGDSVIALWSRVLRALPESRLLIAAAGEERLQERLRAAFAAQGVDPARLDFRPRVALAQYFALHHEVDIALDTFPYSGGTTTSHALWMGVPVLTLAGEGGLQQLQAASMLKMVAMDDWVTATEDAYVDQACRAAAHLPELALLRRELRGRMTDALQGSLETTARELDAAFRTMWRRWCAGAAPESFSVAA
jgi:predicted O-linked N-acetylglucosamine transferase (SPINDLY family)